MEWHTIVATKKQAIILFIKAPNHDGRWLVGKLMTDFSIDSTTLPSIKIDTPTGREGAVNVVVAVVMLLLPP